MRICAWYTDKWSNEGKLVHHAECNKSFRQWNLQANLEPWAYCPEHAPDDKPKKKR